MPTVPGALHDAIQTTPLGHVRLTGDTQSMAGRHSQQCESNTGSNRIHVRGGFGVARYAPPIDCSEPVEVSPRCPVRCIHRLVFYDHVTKEHTCRVVVIWNMNTNVSSNNFRRCTLRPHRGTSGLDCLWTQNMHTPSKPSQHATHQYFAC